MSTLKHLGKAASQCLQHLRLLYICAKNSQKLLIKPCLNVTASNTDNISAATMDWTSTNHIVAIKHTATIDSVVSVLTTDTPTMNATQNESDTSDWNGLNATIRLFVTFFVILGLIGNSLVLLLFCHLKRVKTWDNAFNINLAVGDLTSSVAAIALVFTPKFPTARIISCYSLRVMQWCRLANFMFMQKISLQRYWRVHKPGRIIKKCVFVMGIVIPWTVGIAPMSIALTYMQDQLSASYCVEHAVRLGNIKSWSSLTIFPIMTVVGTVIMTTCYAKIMTSMSRPYPVHCSSSDQNTNGK